jgi:hypothetical protein
MTATLAQVIQRVAFVLGGVSGIRQAPTDPVEQMNVFPFAVVYPTDGEHTFGKTYPVMWHKVCHLWTAYRMHL